MNSFNGLLAAAATSLAVIAAPAAHAACQDCATVIELKTVKKAGEGSGLGAVLGGVAGGVVGHQIGSGRGNDVATVAGAAGGAYAGHQIEKSRKVNRLVIHFLTAENPTPKLGWLLPAAKTLKPT